MYTTISLFYISLLLMAIMIGLKSREVETGRKTIISKFGQSTDHIFVASYLFAKKSISYINRRTAIALAQWFAFHVLLRVRRVYVEIKHRALLNPHGRRLIDAVRGRGEVRHHGASFYLRRIAERN